MGDTKHTLSVSPMRRDIRDDIECDRNGLDDMYRILVVVICWQDFDWTGAGRVYNVYLANKSGVVDGRRQQEAHRSLLFWNIVVAWSLETVVGL